MYVLFTDAISQVVGQTLLAYEIPPPGNILHLPVERLAGRTGRLVVYWEAEPITASLDDFSPLSGNVTFQDGQVCRFTDLIHELFLQGVSGCFQLRLSSPHC